LLNIIGTSEKIHNIKEESLVLKAVKANNFHLTQLLLQHGFPTDEDSSFGRANAVMVACQNNDLKMLKLLIENNADVNKPSHVERKDKSGKKYTVLLHPVFAASITAPIMLKTLLVAGANPNVYGPESKPESGRSCFMYNVVIDKIENQKVTMKNSWIFINFLITFQFMQ
jgi:ankyrin repeat protein